MRVCVLYAAVAIATTACSPQASGQRSFERGEKYFEAQQYREAIIEFRNALARDAAWGAARLRLADAYDADGQRERAYEEYLRAAELLPHDAHARAQAAQHSLHRAERFFAREQWQDALRVANAALKLDRGLLAAHRVRAESAVMLGRFADAQESYQAIVSQQPPPVDAQVALSRLHLAANRVDLAVSYARQAVSQMPDHLIARLALVRAYIGHGDDAAASAELRRAGRLQTRVAEYHVLEGTLQSKRGDTQAARRSFERALQLEPTSRDALAALTTLDVLASNLTAAQRRLASALRSNRDDAALLVLAAKVAMAAGELATAETMLRRAIDRDSSADEAIHLLAQVFHAQHRVRVAVTEFDALVRDDPTKTTPRLIAAVTVDVAGDAIDAERRYKELLGANAHARLAAKNLARLYLLQGTNLSDAEHLLTSMAEQQPDADVFDTLGSIHLRRDDFRAAIVRFAQAVKLNPGRASFHYHLGLGHMGIGNRERARAAFSEALRLDPDLPGARAALASVNE